MTQSRPAQGDRKQAAAGSKRRGPERPGDRRDRPGDDRADDAPRKGRPPLPPGIASRNAALGLLHMTRTGLTLDAALVASKAFNELEGSDRAFARALASTTLRRRGTLDEVIAHYLREPLKAKHAAVFDILRITAAQIVLMDTEHHAAVWSAVELTKFKAETRGFKNMVNAVARRLTETGKEKAEAVSSRADTPGWLWRKLARAHGSKAAAAIAQAHRVEPPLDLTLKNPNDKEPWAEDIEAERLGPQTFRMATRPVQTIPGFEEGSWWVQDLAATLPTTVLAAQEGDTVFDLCAAPGGKTMQLAATGANVFAVDHSGPRTGRLRDNLARTGLNAVVLEEDVLKWSPPNLADKVLLDAPCSATGTIRRNPDLLWTTRETQVPDLVRLQAKMLDQAVALTKPGGTLVYAVCSLLPEEGEEQIEALLRRRDDLERMPITLDEVAGLPVVNKQGDLRCLPSKLKDQGGMDGFFVARLRRKPNQT